MHEDAHPTRLKKTVSFEIGEMAPQIEVPTNITAASRIEARRS
jgi:hypothetical protein